MRNNPFGLPETAADRFMREERERAKFYRDALGGGAVAEAIRQASEHTKLRQQLDFAQPYRRVLDVLERDRKERETFKQLTSTAWALSVTETARSIAERTGGFLEEQRALSNTALETVRAFDLNRGTVAAAIAEARAGDRIRRMIDDALPRFSAFGAIAEQMRLVDAMTLRASEGVVQSATALAAEMVLETQRIAEAIAAASTDEESSALVGELFEKVLAYLASLGPKTIAELNTMGLMQWTAWLFGLLGLVLAVVALQPNPSPQQQAVVADLNQKYEHLQAETQRLGEAEARADEAYVADLPRAELARDATFRRTPERAGDVVLRAPKGTVLAIEKAQGRWCLVVFRDPLSNQLARAWVYATAVTRLAPTLSDASR
jgi:hypothetical protein